MTPGLYPDMPDADYRRALAAHSTGLKDFALSPAKYDLKQRSGWVPNQALRVGSALHTLLLEGQATFQAQTKLVLGTSANKVVQAKAMSEGKLALTQHDMTKVQNMAHAVGQYRPAAELLSGLTHRECALFWDHHGIPCKAKVDGFGTSYAIDVKTSQDCSPDGFRESVRKYGYRLQAGLYFDGLAAVGHPVQHWYWIVVEKEPPFEVAVYRLPPKSLAKGREDYQRLLAPWWNCVETKTWPQRQTSVELLEV